MLHFVWPCRRRNKDSWVFVLVFGYNCYVTMDPIHKKVLANKTSEIMKRISNPVILSAHLKTIFSTGDLEEIEAKTSQCGAITGTQTMLSLLEKRGPKAFTLFVHALLDPAISCADLADDLEQEERKLRGEAGEFFILWEITAVLLPTSSLTKMRDCEAVA